MTLKSDDYKSFAEKFAEAEKIIKKIDLKLEQAIIPAINELRYAGYHLCKAITTDSPEKAEKELNEGKGHIRRAIYDALTAGVVYRFEKIDNFREKYNLKFVNVSKFISDYSKRLLQVRQIRSRLSELSRDEVLETELETLQENLVFLKNFQEELFANDESLRTEAKKIAFQYALLLFGALVAAATLVATIA